MDKVIKENVVQEVDEKQGYESNKATLQEEGMNAPGR